MSQFFKCDDCNSVFLKTFCGGASSGESKLRELIPGTTDGAAEKHIPDVKVDGNTVQVTVGSVEHPMLEAHYIAFIYMETEKGGQIVHLNPGEAPKACLLYTSRCV